MADDKKPEPAKKESSVARSRREAAERGRRNRAAAANRGKAARAPAVKRGEKIRAATANTSGLTAPPETSQLSQSIKAVQNAHPLSRVLNAVASSGDEERQ